jgi:pimeloyl-ACP methyl ester carboxylesterase
VPGFQHLYEFVMQNTGSGWQEKFLLQTPATISQTPAPLLVVFHKYGSSHADVLNTGFLAEGMNRGWFVLCPLGARQKHFGNLESQINTNAALELVRYLYRIDQTRVYGVGFSMGGGAVSNYAARHLDPKGVMFAAICDHTGSVSLGHTWANEVDDGDLDDNIPNPGDNLEPPDVLEGLFGGTPAAQPFAYQRCSSIDLDPVTGQIGIDTDFSRNLAHVPALVWLATGEPNQYLANQTQSFFGHVQPLNPVDTFHSVIANVHLWSTLDYTYVCDWLQQFTLQIPSSGQTLVDEDGQWFQWFVEQDAAGSFTRFTWSVDTATKTIQISGTSNLRRLTVDAGKIGLALHGAVTVSLSTADGLGDKFSLRGVAVAPTSVQRDGVAAAGTFDSSLLTYHFTESDGGAHTWVLAFP